MAATIAVAQRGLLLLHLAPAGSRPWNVDPVIAALAVFWLIAAVIAIWRGAVPAASATAWRAAWRRGTPEDRRAPRAGCGSVNRPGPHRRRP